MWQWSSNLFEWASLGCYLRVVLLSDGETVHDAFPDESFAPHEDQLRQSDGQPLCRGAALPSRRTVEIAEDIMRDLGSDGQPVGYDIQHASTKTEFIARLILEHAPAATE
jgi:hypothetical protein